MQDGSRDASSVVSVNNDTSHKNAPATDIAAGGLNLGAVHMLASQGVKIGATALLVVLHTRILNGDYKKHEISDLNDMFEELAHSSSDDFSHCKKLIETLSKKKN